MEGTNLQNIIEYVSYNEKEQNLYIPNEIFEDFQNDERIKKANIPFAFSYYYLVNYLYRFCKYGEKTESKHFYTNNELKEMLGMAASNKKVDYLIKKNGVLEEMQYLETTKFIPTSWSYGESVMYKSIDHELKFDYIYNQKDYFIEWKDYLAPLPKKYTIKRPVKAFERKPEGELYDMLDEEGYFNYDLFDGTYFIVDNTTHIPFEVFAFCMEREELGCRGFYLYCYLKQKSDYFGGDGYDVPYAQLEYETKIPHGTFNKVMKALKQHRMIDVLHNQEYFCLGLKQEDRKANTYVPLDWELFDDDGKTQIDRMKVMDRKTYFKKLEEEKKERDKLKAQVNLDELPY